MSEQCERRSERRSQWPSILRVDFTVIVPIVSMYLVKIAFELREAPFASRTNSLFVHRICWTVKRKELMGHGSWVIVQYGADYR